MDKYQFIQDLANDLAKKRQTKNGWEVAKLLNDNGYFTNNNTPFQGGRGVYKLIHATYDRLKASGLNKDADNVAAAFKNQNGEYAYD